ncbi:MAG: hypothetical protein JO269_11230 [Burkholderiaceae bacterium]|nr:hypothetical protein [Burkholderiaceae bacterium]
MAGDWIKMRVDLYDDPAVIALSQALRLDEFAVVGRLHKLWSWGDRHMVGGLAAGVTLQWIDRYVCCPGFARRMQMVGWLEAVDEGIVFPRFDRHNGASAKQRMVATERKRVQRARPQDAVPSLSLKERDKTKDKPGDQGATREEKKREEGGKPNRTPLPEDFAISEEVQAWARERGATELQTHFDFFVRKARANGYLYANWDLAFKNAVIDDWAKLTSPHQPKTHAPPKPIRSRQTAKPFAQTDYSEGVTADGRIV